MHFKKQYGQNFLTGDKYAQKLVAALDLQPDDVVVEIGPGDGRVTNLLLQKAARVICVEVDYQLIPKLVARFSKNPKFELLHQDILMTNIGDVLYGSYKLTGSLPYNISKQIIYKFLTAEPRPAQMAFIIQQEVAEEYTAVAPKATFLSNWIRLYADVKKMVNISAAQFYPKPKVNGAILQLKPLAEIDFDLVEALSSFIRAAFASPRKTLWNNLHGRGKFGPAELASAWSTLQLGDTARPAELSADTWQKLAILLDI